MTTTTVDTRIEATRAGRGLGTGLWAAQALLGVAFLGAGATKLTTPIDQLVTQMPWASSMPEALVRFIGASEVAGALGVILPAATRIAPKLTPIAAAGLTTVMALASLVHASRGEWPMIGANAVLGGLAAFVAWGRWKRAPIAAR